MRCVVIVSFAVRGARQGVRDPVWRSATRDTQTEKMRDLTLKTAIFPPAGEAPRFPDETRYRSKPCEANRCGLEKNLDFFVQAGSSGGADAGRHVRRVAQRMGQRHSSAVGARSQ